MNQRRHCTTSALTIVALVALSIGDQFQVIAQVPNEPVDVARGVPQFFIDDWLVDNRYAVKYKHNAVVHSVHPPRKHEANPVYRGDCGYVNVARHPESGKFQLWSQVHYWAEKPSGRSSRYAIAYAESNDGLNWDAPNVSRPRKLGDIPPVTMRPTPPAARSAK